MTVAQQTPPAEMPKPAPAPQRTNGRWAGFRHLLRARMLELKREPEVVFWVFGFPILLADVPVNAQEVTARRVHQALPQPSMANSSRRLIRNSAV